MLRFEFHTLPALALLSLALPAWRAPCFANGPAALSGLLHLSPARVGLEKSEREVREDLEFARGLASQWQFVDMASELLDGLAAEKLSAELKEEVDLVRCEVFAAAALGELELARKEELYNQALDSYKSFTERNPDSDLAEQAKRSYIDLAAEYGLFMEERLEQAGAEETKRIREALDNQLTEVAGFSGELLESVKSTLNEDSGPDERSVLYRLMLARGNLLLILGRTALDGDYYLGSSEEMMEELAYAADPTSGWAMTAWERMGRIKEARGLYEEAADYYDYVSDEVAPQDLEQWNNIKQENPRETVENSWAFYERTAGPSIDTRIKAGQVELATARGLHFYNLLSVEGFKLAAPGHLSLLSFCNALLAAGGYVGGSIAAGNLTWYETLEELEAAGHNKRDRRSAAELSLAIASKVNEDNQGNVLQAKAQRLISKAVDTPGISVTSEILLEAALGSFNGNDFEAAIPALRRVMDSLSTDADRKLYMPKIQWYLGSSFRQLERPLEAAMAYREGVTHWRGDAEWDPQNSSGYYSMMNGLRREIKGDSTIDQLFGESEVLQSSVGEGGDSIDWRRSQREFDAGNFEGARSIAQSIEPGSTYYEKALVRAAASLYQAGDAATAEKELIDFLEDYLNNPRNRLEPNNLTALKLRNEARAEAIYTRGQILRGAGKWAEMSALYANFAEEFKGQDQLIAATLYYRCEAAIELGKDEEADRLLERLIADFPKDDYTGSAATKLYNAYVSRFEKAAEGSPERKELKTKMASTLALSNSLADDPGFTALFNEANFWVELENWERAEPVLSKLRANFAESKNEKEAKAVRQSVLPKLGLTYLGQKRVQEAYDVLAPLIPKWHDTEPTTQRTSFDTTMSYARSVAGWFEGNPTAPTIVPGVGGAEALENSYGWLDKIRNSQERWSCEWLESTLLQAWIGYQWGQISAKQKGWAKTLLGGVQVEKGATFAGIAETCGNDTLQGQFRWLWSKVQ